MDLQLFIGFKTRTNFTNTQNYQTINPHSTYEEKTLHKNASDLIFAYSRVKARQNVSTVQGHRVINPHSSVHTPYSSSTVHGTTKHEK